MQTNLSKASQELTAKTSENAEIARERRKKRVFILLGSFSGISLLIHQCFYVPLVNYQTKIRFTERQQQVKNYERQLNYFCEIKTNDWKKKCENWQRSH